MNAGDVSQRPKRYDQLLDLIDLVKPARICEVGTSNGLRAIGLCRRALRHRGRVHYIGFDLFEDGNPSVDALELNGKGRSHFGSVHASLEAAARLAPGMSFELIKGNTRDTLHGRRIGVDFAYIDGGHSVATIEGDYEALAGSGAVVLDDYYSGGVIDGRQFGCNRVVERFKHRVLPIQDPVREGGYVQLVIKLPMVASAVAIASAALSSEETTKTR